VASKKPIAVIKHLPAQQLSDSLYRGYPVFTWQKLQAGGLRPLRRFLAFATRSRSDVWPQFQRSVAGFGTLVGTGVVVWWVISAVLDEIYKLVLAFAPRNAEAIAVGWLWATFILLAVVFAAAFAQMLYRRIRGLAVASQKIRTREATFAEFSAIFSLLKAEAPILNVLERTPLEPRHD